ncbi:hypothetical protein PGB90_009499 [Kerria lacca]
MWLNFTSSNLTNNASTYELPVTSINSTENHPVSYNILETFMNEDDGLSTTLDSIVYNTSMDDDFDSNGYATVAITDFLKQNFKLSSVPQDTSSYVSETESLVSVRNISSLTCLNRNIPSVNEYLADEDDNQLISVNALQ